ncbi:MAG TPA: inorganic diphosphatase [Candidatus Bathyarchaeia archaeon]|nr:inorganic diphosphatase [Candidatus Bathyarchaeia archaeon]
MPNLWTDVIPGPNPPELVYAVIETPQGSKNKFEFDKEIMAIYLDRVLYSSVVFPISYGFIPRTLGDDKDPLDIMVYITEPTFPGCLVTARPIGVLRMKDEKGDDDKIIAVASNDPRLNEANELDWIPKHQLIEIEDFFRNYKKLEKGKKTEVQGWENREDAYKIINTSIEFFQEKYFDIMNKKFLD